MNKPKKTAASGPSGFSSGDTVERPVITPPRPVRRSPFSTLQTVLHTLGDLLVIEGGLLLIPLILVPIFGEKGTARVFLLSSAACFASGLLLRRVFARGRIYYRQSLLICGSAWIVLSIFACLPFLFTTDKPFLDCYFETVSGFTTTGITIYTDIPAMARSVLFWRSLIQWLGGLGILTLFLAVTFRSNGAYYQLFAAESHKIDSSRPTPSVFRTVVILWSLYGAFTLAEFLVLTGLGMEVFDALCHSLTTLSTGGFSPYDESIDYFRQAGYAHYRAIEYTVAFFMLLGGINFLLHFKLLSGNFREVFRDTELRFFLFLILAATGLILLDHSLSTPRSVPREADFRHTVFTVVSVITTTGFGTVDINDAFFPAMARQILLAFMLFGGCVGSTAGGIKTLRIYVLYRLFVLQIRRLVVPRRAISELVIDGRIFPVREIKRITGLFVGWIVLIALGGFLTALLTNLDSWQAFSGMFSAVGNIGPCYFSVRQMSELPAAVKLVYIFGMLAGRLEILPILLLASRRAWRS
jgi:trk system potassium uptake protein TrkH